jgi:hypothetical protein
MADLIARYRQKMAVAADPALRAASFRPQVKSGCSGCGKVTRRANHQKSVHPFAQKDSA